MGFFEDEWVYLAKACEDNGVDMLELNFSCPHMCIEGSGHKVGQAFHLLERFTAAVKQAVSIPVMAKMTPNITDMTEPALYAKKGGADAISAINTVRGISEVGRDDWVPRPNVFGVGAISGTSGPAVKRSDSISSPAWRSAGSWACRCPAWAGSRPGSTPSNTCWSGRPCSR